MSAEFSGPRNKSRITTVVPSITHRLEVMARDTPKGRQRTVLMGHEVPSRVRPPHSQHRSLPADAFPDLTPHGSEATPTQHRADGLQTAMEELFPGKTL